eukprot:scaffold17510_cov26-Prasinocladus_malaysianus.AAC.1
MSINKGLCSGPGAPCGSFRRPLPAASPQTPPSPCRDETGPLPTSEPSALIAAPRVSRAAW